MYFLRYKIPDEGETKFRGGFRPGGSVGCFGMIVMFFVNKKVEKISKNRKSLISRNRGFKSELRKSVRRLKERTLSMVSLASSNWKQSRMNLSSSISNISLKERTRRASAVDQSQSQGREVTGRRRHMSMQDRVEMYNTVLALEQEENRFREQ